MIVKQSGGMTEFIPSPSEKRDGVIRNHVLDLLANLDARLRRIEEAAGLPTGLADDFSYAMARITCEEAHVRRLNEKVLDAGVMHRIRPTPQIPRKNTVSVRVAIYRLTYSLGPR